MSKTEFQVKYGGQKQQAVLNAVDALSRPFLQKVGNVTKEAAEYFTAMIDNSSFEELEAKAEDFPQEVLDFIVKKYDVITEGYSNSVATKLIEYDSSFDDYAKYKKSFDQSKVSLPDTNVALGDYTAGDFLHGARNAFITAGVALSLVHITGVALGSYTSTGIAAKLSAALQSVSLVNPIVVAALLGTCAYYGHKEAKKKELQETRKNFKNNLKTIISTVEKSLFGCEFDAPTPYFEEFLKTAKANVVVALNDIYQSHLSLLEDIPSTENDSNEVIY